MQNAEGRMKADPQLFPDSAICIHPSAFPRPGWLGWAIFLGMSWTWCIGMFLPVLLVRDYGAWAWLIFAIPNVMGAAAMGWVLDRRRSELMAAAHRPAMTAFSVITVAFQLFFAIWIFSAQSTGRPWYLLGVGIVAAAAAVRKSSRVLAILLLIASAACAIGMFHDGAARLGDAAGMFQLPQYPPSDLVWLAPVCLLGFLLCPYLDTTFHRARQHTENPEARISFGLGFGVVFCSAIVLSLLYAKPVSIAMFSHPATAVVLRWIKIYWMMQLGFTIGVHLIGDDAQDQPARARTSGIVLFAGIAVAALAAGAAFKLHSETLYRSFLGFYGLVFPAYVLLCVVPGGGIVAPSRAAITIFAIAVAIAAPLFGEAFLAHRLIWAGPGVAVVLLAWLFVPKSATSPLPQPTGLIAQQNSAPTS
jgi:hypothetical protein